MRANRKLRILLLEDNLADAELNAEQLLDAGSLFDPELVECFNAGVPER